jgi:hypothetical protein
VNDVVWWTKSIAGILLCLFFLVLGIDLCRAAYHLNHPQQFIMSFFASNLIILLSLVFLAGVVVRIIARLRPEQQPPEL